MDSLFTNEEIKASNNTASDGAVMVEGVMRDGEFHPDRLESHKEEIKELLEELHPNFKEGWSFLNMAEDKHGKLWGQHIDVENLILMSIGLGLMKYCAPREIWSALPGGMPYVQVIVEKEECPTSQRC